jgi:hypothetical protein
MTSREREHHTEAQSQQQSDRRMPACHEVSSCTLGTTWIAFGCFELPKRRMVHVVLGSSLVVLPPRWSMGGPAGKRPIVLGEKAPGSNERIPRWQWPPCPGEGQFQRFAEPQRSVRQPLTRSSRQPVACGSRQRAIYSLRLPVESRYGEIPRAKSRMHAWRVPVILQSDEALSTLIST